MRYEPPWKQRMREKDGFQHNPNPPIWDDPSVLPFPCYRHLMEARVLLPPDTLRERRKRLMDPKWNPRSAARLNRNRRMMQQFMDEGSTWEVMKRIREEEDEASRPPPKVRRTRPETDDVAESRRRLKELELEAERRDRERRGIPHPLGNFARRLEKVTTGLSLRSPPAHPSPPASPSSSDSSSPPRSPTFSAATSPPTSPSSLGSSSPPPSPTAKTLFPPRSKARPIETHPLTLICLSTLSLKGRLCPPPPAPSPPTNLSTDPPTAKFNPEPTTTNSNSTLNPDSLQVTPLRRNESKTTPSTRDNYTSLTWLLEEQDIDLYALDGYQSHCPPPPLERNRKDGIARYPQFDGYTHHWYHNGAYKLDEQVLFQARVANWRALGGGEEKVWEVARRVGEWFAREGGNGWVGRGLSME
jgi:hypothetical protein